MDVELNNLTEAERDVITSVLRRDEDLRKREMDRIRKLRNEVKRIRMKGVIKAGHDPMKTCARCRTPFGWLFNKGAICTKCQHKVCDKCRSTLSKVSNKWLCNLCYKQKELDAQTNRWFYSQFRKSKRNRKTNNVITGPEIVKASMKRAHRDAASGSGSDGGRSSIGDEIKRVLSNNNASPKSRRAGEGSTRGGMGEEAAAAGESSDTQSMGASSPRHRKHNHHHHPPRDVAAVTFPKDSDRQRLFDLIRPKSVEDTQANPTLQVKRVVSKKYSDSESSSSGSEASSPNLSTRPESSFCYSDSVRSSLRSSSAVSSDGRMTIVTESCISDIDTISMMSEMPQETPIMVPRGDHQENVKVTNHVSPPRGGGGGGGTLRSPSDPSHSNSTLDEYEPAETVIVHKMINRRRESMSSDSDDEFTTEQITKVKFRRVSKVKGSRSRSPSPESRPGRHPTTTSSGRTSNTSRPSRDKQSGGAVKVVQKQQKIHETEENGKHDPHQPHQPREKDQLINGDNPVRDYGDGVSSKVAPPGGGDGDYEPCADSPRHHQHDHHTREDANNSQHDVPSSDNQAVQQDESPRDLSEDEAATPTLSGGEEDDDVTKAESPLVTSSPKRDAADGASGAGDPEVVEREPEDDLEESIRVDDDDLEDIDDIVASVTATPTRSAAPKTPSNAPINRSTGNLLSAFSASKESIASYYSDAGEGHYGNVSVTGEILYGLDYNYKTGSLEISVKQCRDLAAVDKKRNRSDPYVKTYLLPDKTKSGKRKTRAKKHTLSPSFDELLKYQITKSELETRTLWISVWNNDTFGRNDFLGEVSMPLDYYPFDDPAPQWYKLQDRGLHSKIKKYGKELPRPKLPLSRQGSPSRPASAQTSALKRPAESSPPAGAGGAGSAEGGLSKQKSKSVSFLDTSAAPHLPKLSASQSQEMLSSANSGSMALITYKGDLDVLLKFVTADSVGSSGASKKSSRGGSVKSRGELHVLIQEARNLTAVRSNGTSDPFCKGYLLPEKTRGTKQKTPVVKRNVNPAWNHTFVFEDVSLDDLRERAVELTVWDHDRFTSNDFLGGVRLNMGTGLCGGKKVDWMDARGEEISVWEHMLDHPNEWQKASLMLRHSMGKKT